MLYAKTGAGIVNQGMIVVGTAGTDAGVAIRGNFTNQGTITVTSTAGLGARGGTFDNAAAGLLAIGTSSYATFGSKGDTFSNQGTITLNTGAKLHLGGRFQQSDLSGIVNSGGTVFLDGTLSNSGTVLSGGSAGALGTVVLDGTVIGGTLAGGGVLFRGGTLANASYIGTLDLSAAGSRLTVVNGITLTPAAGGGPDTVLVTGNSSYLDFIGSQTLNNVGITLGTSGQFGLASLRAIGTATSLTLGHGVTINPVGAAQLYAMAGDTIDNTGTITVEAANSGLTIVGSFFNDGVITVSHNDPLSVGLLGGSGGITLSGGATVSFKGVVGSGETVNFLDHSGRLSISQPGSFAAAVQGFLDGDAIDLLSIGVAASYTYDSVSHQLILKNAGGTQVAQLSLSLSPTLANPQFVLGKDAGGGGTLLTVQNGNTSGTLTGTYTGGLVLSNPSVQNPTTLAAGSYVANNTTSHSGDAVYGTTAAAWQVTSYGTIKSNGAAGTGIDLRAGGTIIIKAGGAVTATDDGIDISGAAGSVTNSGYIEGRIGGLTSGIDLKAGGTVTNQVGGTILAGHYGVSIYADGDVTNAGYIGGAVAGVFLNSSGIVTNQAGATITGLFPIHFNNTAATLINAGMISGKSIAVFLDGGAGVVINQKGGVIKGPVGSNDAIFARNATGYVNNAGYIGGAGAIEFSLGGTVVNQIGGTIAGSGVGFFCSPFGTFASGPGTLTNAGLVSGGYRAVYLTAGGTITNQSGGSIVGTGTAGIGVFVKSAGGTLANAGTVMSTGTSVVLSAGGSVNNSGTIIGTGTLSDGVVIGTAIFGTSGSTITGVGVVSNSGLVSGGRLGVWLKAGGSVVNSGTIIGNGTAAYGFGVFVGSAANGPTGAVYNSGLITSTSYGVLLDVDGSISNFGTIISSGSTVGAGIYGNRAANVVNHGVIRSGRIAVLLSEGNQGAKTVTNYGSILSSGSAGIFLGMGGLVTNTLAERSPQRGLRCRSLPPVRSSPL